MPKDRTFGSRLGLAATMVIFDGQPVEVYCHGERDRDALAWLRPPNRTRLLGHQIGGS
jgi:hypothetical protein